MQGNFDMVMHHHDPECRCKMFVFLPSHKRIVRNITCQYSLHIKYVSYQGSHLSAKSLIYAKTKFPNQRGGIPSEKPLSPQKKILELVFSLRNSSRRRKQMRFRVRYQCTQDLTGAIFDCFFHVASL